MLLANVSVSPSVRNTARRAFDGACEELGLGDFSLDVAKRERLAQEMERLVCKGGAPGRPAENCGLAIQVQRSQT